MLEPGTVELQNNRILQKVEGGVSLAAEVPHEAIVLAVGFDCDAKARGPGMPWL